MIGEFELIQRYLKPLAAGAPGAFDLSDDAALLAPPPGRDLVVTADAMVAGVHFLADDPPDLVARKLLRVNLSDLAAMGAEPTGYLLAASWPESIGQVTGQDTRGPTGESEDRVEDEGEPWIAAFAAGLAADQAEFGVVLLGGDTTRTPGPMTLSLTAIGSVPAGRCLRRSTARAGDLVFVSGSIGDGALGLEVLRDGLPRLPPEHAADLADRYRLPRPRLALGQRLLAEGLASAALDVSDGLVADLGHIAGTSGLAAVLEAAAVPLSPAAQAALAAEPERLRQAITGGDDYELLFTAAPAQSAALAAVAEALGLPLTRIGAMSQGQGVRVRDAAGAEMSLEHAGWTHF